MNKVENADVTIKMPISRWLKADERLAEVIKELEENINKNKTLSVERALGETQHEIIASKISELKADLAKCILVQDERIRIRNEVARKNSANGVNFKLARLSMLKKRIELLKKIICEQRPDMMTPEEFKEAVEQRKMARIKPVKNKAGSNYNDDWMELFGDMSNSRYDAKVGLSIRVLDTQETEQLKSQIQNTELEIFELKSEIAESNVEQLAIKMPVEVAGYFKKI